MIEVTQSTFARDVLERSREAPVLVDFWAPWCAPCRTLAPLLDGIEREFKGRLAIVKLNIDDNQELAKQYGVRSIPYVVAFVDGQAVDSFVGVLPVDALREFVGRLLPDAAEIERRKARRLLEHGDVAGATSALRAAMALDPERDAVRLDLAELLLSRPGTGTGVDGAELDEAAAALNGVSAAGKLDTAWTTLHTQLQSQRRAAELPAPEALAARVAQSPDDLQARFDLASVLLARREFEPALEHLLAMVERDRSFNDDIARKTMLSVFDLAADQPQLVSAFRRRLAAALNR